jgi:hypothetical protein
MFQFGRIVLKLIFWSTLLALLTEPAWSLPIFARRYETSCTTCHVVIPKLNAFGIAFRNNGYRIPLDDEALVKTKDVPLGADEWKKLWPKAVWPGAIPGIPPVAVRVITDVNFRPSTPVNVNFDFPNGINGYFAGSAGESFSFFGSVFLQGSTNAIFLDRAYGQFKLFHETSGQNWLTVKVGRIDTRAEPFSSTFRRTTSQNFNIGDFRATSGGFAFRDHDAGIELWGAATGPDNRGGVEYAAGIVQGTAGRPENNNFKDYYWTASYKLGGLGVVGSRMKESANPNSPQGYSETAFTIGTFSYIGKSQPQIVNVSEDRFTRTGVKVDVWLQKLNVFGTAVLGNDELRGLAPKKVDSSAFMAEADYKVLPWVMPVFRVEKTNYSDGRRATNLAVPAVNFLIRANVRLLAEGRFYSRIGQDVSGKTGLNEGLIRLDFLF